MTNNHLFKLHSQALARKRYWTKELAGKSCIAHPRAYFQKQKWTNLEESLRISILEYADEAIPTEKLYNDLNIQTWKAK